MEKTGRFGMIWRIYLWWKGEGRSAAMLKFEPSRAAAMAAMGVEEIWSSSGKRSGRLAGVG